MSSVARSDDVGCLDTPELAGGGSRLTTQQAKVREFRHRRVLAQFIGKRGRRICPTRRVNQKVGAQANSR